MHGCLLIDRSLLKGNSTSSYDDGKQGKGRTATHQSEIRIQVRSGISMAPYTRQQKSETRLERKVKAVIHVLLDRHRGMIVWRQTKRSRMRQITFWVRDGSNGFTRDCRSRTRAVLFVDLCCMLSRQPQSTARPLTILPTISRLDYAESGLRPV